MTATLTATSADDDRSGRVVKVVVLAAEGVAQGVDGVPLESESYVGIDAGGDADVGVATRSIWQPIAGQETCLPSLTSGPRGHFVMCVRKAAHVVGDRPSRGPDASFESRMRTVAGGVATSTQFELSPLWLDLRQRMVCTVFLLRLSG